MTTSAKGKWVIDPMHSEIQFKVKHLVISTVTGNFEKFEGSLEVSSDDFSQATASFSAEVDSINTKVADRDAHLKSPDFFDAANHPKLTFASRKISKTGDGSYKLTGDLTIRGTTRELVLDVEFGGIMVDPWGNTKAGFELSGKVNRKEFGLHWSAVTETGGLVVSDEVKIVASVELAKVS